MTFIEERKNILNAIKEATSSGARLRKACIEIGLSVRTFQRWKKDECGGDKRPSTTHRADNALTQTERSEVMQICNSPEYRDLSPNEIVPLLAEKGTYIASESTMYRILREANMLEHRQNTRPATPRKKPDELIATGRNQVWSWDITYMRTKIHGAFFYLYLHLDIWSKMIVGWSVEDKEDGEVAAEIFAETCLRHDAYGVRLHSDNGSPMKSAHMLSTLQMLGVVPSFSRPGVSDDNPFSESLFKTMKYRPGYPGSFETIQEAREWVARFVDWYNKHHRHSAIRYVTPEQRHYGHEEKILNKRKEVYQEAAKRNPKRFANGCRNWNPIQIVELNPKSHQDRLKVCA